MEITTRGLWTLVHGMGFGALYLLACSGALVELWRRYAPTDLSPITEREEAFLRWYLLAMALLAWIAVLTGTYIIYPWYRAIPQAGTVNLGGYPQRLLLSNPATSGWPRAKHPAWRSQRGMSTATTIRTSLTSRRWGGIRRNWPRQRLPSALRS